MVHHKEWLKVKIAFCKILRKHIGIKFESISKSVEYQKISSKIYSQNGTGFILYAGIFSLPSNHNGSKSNWSAAQLNKDWPEEERPSNGRIPCP